MTRPFLTVARTGAVVTLTMSRPEERNAISDIEACRQFVEVCDEIGADHGVSVVVLTGLDPAFSAGGNLKRMRDRTGFAPKATPVATRQSYRETIQRIPLPSTTSMCPRLPRSTDRRSVRASTLR